MSQRQKRQAGKPDDPGPMGKRKRRKLSGSEDADSQLAASASGQTWTPKHLGDLKAYNKKAVEKPGELIRTDLISAMKLADSEYLSPDEYLEIADQWKQEWERGVQVPVNPDTLPHPRVSSLPGPPARQHDFRLPKKLLRVTHTSDSPERYHMSNAPAKAEKVCRYDLDDQDSVWLNVFNGERARMGAPPVEELEMERVIEDMERQCWNKLQAIVKTQEGLSIEYDENVVCDVCQQPDSEENNEMVFCDKCNICVHQMCYGITKIPDGSWMCKPCALGIKPDCVLCPNKGGAMKSTRSGHKWAHVSCALWIPEVSIGDVDMMEPVTKISNISARRWSLICVLCKEKVGACIQCSVRSCKTAYHVTCAFKGNLIMKPVEDESDDDIKLKSYCPKHSKNEKLSSKSDSEGDSRRGGDADFEAQRRTRKQKLQQIESEFYQHVDMRGAAAACSVPVDVVEFIYNYWKLKRKSGGNKALLTPNTDEIDLRTEQQQQDLEKIKQIVHIRQNLEKVRNLCYMVKKRQKQCGRYFQLREQTFLSQAAVLRQASPRLSPEQRRAVLDANHIRDDVYDRHYSHANAELHTHPLHQLLDVIRGGKSAAGVGAPLRGLNGAVRRPSGPDPYRRQYVNGAQRRRHRLASSGTSDTDGSRDRRGAGDVSSADEHEHSRAVSGPRRPSTATERLTKQALFGKDSSESDSGAVARAAGTGASAAQAGDKHRRPGRHKTGAALASRKAVIADSSDDDLPLRSAADSAARGRGRPRTRVVDSARGVGDAVTSDSDSRLVATVKSARHIYTDSESDADDEKLRSASSVSSSAIRTKAAMKSFMPAANTEDSASGVVDDASQPKRRGRKKKMELAGSSSAEPSPVKGKAPDISLIVPPRQAMLDANKRIAGEKRFEGPPPPAVSAPETPQKRGRGRPRKSPDGRSASKSPRVGSAVKAEPVDEGADNVAVQRDVRLRRPEKQPFRAGGRSGHTYKSSTQSHSATSEQDAAAGPSSVPTQQQQQRRVTASSGSSSSSSSSGSSSSSSSSGSSSSSSGSSSGSSSDSADSDAETGGRARAPQSPPSARGERGAAGRARTVADSPRRAAAAAATAGGDAPPTEARRRLSAGGAGEPGQDSQPAAKEATAVGRQRSPRAETMKKMRPMPRSRKIALGLEAPQANDTEPLPPPAEVEPTRRRSSSSQKPLRGSIDSILSEKSVSKEQRETTESRGAYRASGDEIRVERMEDINDESAAPAAATPAVPRKAPADDQPLPPQSSIFSPPRLNAGDPTFDFETKLFTGQKTAPAMESSTKAAAVAVEQKPAPSIFSPPRGNSEEASLELDPELLGLSKEPEPMTRAPAIMETKEESQQVTMDLVEKLRLQYAQQGPEEEKPEKTPARSTPSRHTPSTPSRGGPGDTPTRPGEPSKWRPLTSVVSEPEPPQTAFTEASRILPAPAERKVEPSPTAAVSSLPGKPPPAPTVVSEPPQPASVDLSKPAEPTKPPALPPPPPPKAMEPRPPLQSPPQQQPMPLLQEPQVHPPPPHVTHLPRKRHESRPEAALLYPAPSERAGFPAPPLPPGSVAGLLVPPGRGLGAVNVRTPASINAASPMPPPPPFGMQHMLLMQQMQHWPEAQARELMQHWPEAQLREMMQHWPEEQLREQFMMMQYESSLQQQQFLLQQGADADLKRRTEEAEMEHRKQAEMLQRQEERARKEAEERHRRFEEEQRRREEEDRLQREEKERRRREEELRRQVEEEEQRRRMALEEEERRRQEEEERRRREEEERRRREEEEIRRREEEEERRRQEEEELRRRREEEEQQRKREEEEQRRRMEEEQRRIREEEEKRKRQEEEERKRKEEEERMTRELERLHQEMIRRQEEEARKKEEERLQALMAEQEAELRRTLLAPQPPPVQPPAERLPVKAGADLHAAKQPPPRLVTEPDFRLQALEALVNQQEPEIPAPVKPVEEPSAPANEKPVEVPKPATVPPQPVIDMAKEFPRVIAAMEAMEQPPAASTPSLPPPASEPAAVSQAPSPAPVAASVRSRGRRESSLKATMQIQKMSGDTENDGEAETPARVRSLPPRHTSPGKSPRAAAETKTSGRGRKSGKASAAAAVYGRGRGRGRGRGNRGRAAATPRAPFCPKPQVPNDLAGTVYDFDDDEFSDDLPKTPRQKMRPVRERFLSTDVGSDRAGSVMSELADDASSQSSLPHAAPMPQVLPTLTQPGASETSMESACTPPRLTEEAPIEPETGAPTLSAAPTTADAPPDLPLAQPIESVCDEGNQLKLKIKGPFLNPKYNQQQAVVPAEQPAAAATAADVCVNSNLRKRKKELIRQYINMTETEATAEPVPPREDSGMVSRFICPKAVKSVSSAPTRDDYRGAVAGKDVSVAALAVPKRRGRPPRELAAAVAKDAASPHKLRISLGKDGRANEVKPPKKRSGELAAGGKMSVFEKIRLDNLQFGDQVLASFDSEPPPAVDKKPKKKKKKKDKDRDKEGGKEKKKKDKSHKHSKVQIINNDSAAAPKLIIKLGGRKLTDSPLPVGEAAGEGGAGSSTPPPPLSQPTPPPSDDSGGHKDLVVKIKPLTSSETGGEPGRLQPLKLTLSRRGPAFSADTPPPPTLTPEVAAADAAKDSCDVR